MQRLHSMPSTSSYADCVAFYAKARRWKSPARYGWQTQIGEPKKIDKAGKEYKSVRQVKHDEATDGVAYAWRYHDTDVVTWLTEDSIDVVPWASMSTTSFMEALLPAGFCVNMHNPLGCMIGVHNLGSPPDIPAYGTVPEAEYEAAMERWRLYWRERHGTGVRWFLVPENETVRLRRVENKWSILDTKTIDYPQVNKVKAAAARKDFDTNGLGAWLTAILAMNQRVTVKDMQAHAALRAGDLALCLAEDMHANSEIGLQFMQDAMRNPELYWAFLACPHLRPPQRYTRAGRTIGRTHREEMRDWLAHMKHSALLAAYRKHDAVEVMKFDSLVSLDMGNRALRMAQHWDCAHFNWPVVE